MAQSIFSALGAQFIDAIDQDFAPPEIWNLGVQFSGTSKSFVRRCLGGFDVFGPAFSGRPLLAADEVTSAELVLQTTNVIGPGAWDAVIERLDRPDWDYLTADWLRFKAGAAWSTPGGGGDVATPPVAIAFTSPGLTGEHIITGLAAFVTDAIANRGGNVLLRLKAAVEDPPQTQWCSYDAALSSSARPRLRITYDAAEPDDIDNPRQSFGAERAERIASALHADVPAEPDAPSRPAKILRSAQDDMTDD